MNKWKVKSFIRLETNSFNNAKFNQNKKIKNSLILTINNARFKMIL